MPRLGLAAASLLLSLAATGANLDLHPDAVLGKPDFVTPPQGIATSINLMGPFATAEDPASGEFWVVDEAAHRVLRYASASAFASGEAANLVLGQATLSGSQPNRGGLPAANTLQFPTAVVVDQAGRLYVADLGNHRVLRFRPPFSNGMNAAEVAGQSSFTANACNRGGTPGLDTLCNPAGLALKEETFSGGRLYVADRNNHRIVFIDTDDMTGFDYWGQASASGNIPATSDAGLRSPTGLALDSQEGLWIADTGNHRVVHIPGVSTAYNIDKALCQPSTATGAAGSGAAGCNQPRGVAVDPSGVVYVADYGNSRLLRFDAPATGASASAVEGQADFTGTACNRTIAFPLSNTLCNPAHVALDGRGNLLVADFGNDRVLRFDVPRNRPVPVLDSISPTRQPRGGGPFTLTVTGTYFTADSVVRWNGSPRATQYLSQSRLLAQVTAADIAGITTAQVSVATPAPGGGTTANRPFSTYTPAPLDAVADRVLGAPDFVAPADARAVGEETVGANAATFQARYIAIDPVSGRLFLSDMHRVLSWPSAAGFRNGESADIAIGQRDLVSNSCNAPGLGASSLCNPRDVAVDPQGRLYVADGLNNRVLRFDAPYSTGMAASRVFGQNGSFIANQPNDPGIGAGTMASPTGIAVNGERLAVFDSANRRVLVFDNPDASTVATRVIGQADPASAQTLPTSALSVSTSGGSLAFDAEGHLLVSDYEKNRILRFRKPFTPTQPANMPAADLVIGQGTFTGAGAGTTAATLSGPVMIAFDPAGNLLATDLGNYRIVRYSAPLATGMAASGVLGQPNLISGASGSGDTGFDFGPTGIAIDHLGNVVATDSRRVLAFDRPFAFALDPAGDFDRDGIPNGIEAGEARDPFTKDNDVFGNTRLFAMQQYRDFLSREGDAGGIAFWIAQLAGPQTRAQAIQGFFNSPEFQGVIAPVARLYFANFLRYPDYAGLQFHVARSRTGTALDVIANDFATSPEFISRYGALTNDAFIELVYNNVLGRPSDPGGKAYWLSQMAGGFTRGQVMLGFSESPEYVAAIGNEVFITMMYVGMLRRAPDPVGFGYWLTQLDGGQSSLGLTQGFLDAPEYHGRFLP